MCNHQSLRWPSCRPRGVLKDAETLLTQMAGWWFQPTPLKNMVINDD